MVQGKFHGLTKGKDGDKTRKNYWNIKSLQWEENSDDKSQGFGVTKVVDNEGNPFIKFICDLGYSAGCALAGGLYLAKK